MYNKASYTDSRYQYPYQGIYTTIGPTDQDTNRNFFFLYIIGLIYISDYLCLFKKKFRTIALYLSF